MHGRPRLTLAELIREPGSRVRARVTLERKGLTFTGERQGVGEETMILRLGAEATLQALEGVVGGKAQFELVGIKAMHAFDTRIVLVCVRPVDEPRRRLVGCVPTGDDPVRGAATAVLHAINRLVEILPTPEDPTTGS